MEIQYDVGTTNRYALFLEEGENELPIIKKKISKELRAKTKQEKKEHAEAKKIEATIKVEEKPKKQDPKVEEISQPKKETKENKNEVPKNRDRRLEDDFTKHDKNSQDKSRNLRNGDAALSTIENWDSEVSFSNDAPPPRTNYENRKPRDRKYENSDQQHSKNYTGPRKYNNRDNHKNGSSNSDVIANGTDHWDAQENGNDQQQTEYRPRGGNKYGGNNQGGRNSYGGGDRRRNYNEDRHENKEDADNIKSDSWNEEKPQNAVENSDNQNEEAKGENDCPSNEQKEEVKEMLTLDEWKKLKGEREKPQYNLRKAGEGEDLSQWKNMRELQKSNEIEFLENGYGNNQPSKKSDDKENSGAENNQRNVRPVIELDYHFREPAVRGGRGGRGGGRGGRFGYKGKTEDRYGSESRSFRRNREGRVSGGGSSGGRGPPRQNAPKITDERDFPSLG